MAQVLKENAAVDPVDKLPGLAVAGALVAQGA
jgi:hypothetical protein